MLIKIKEIQKKCFIFFINFFISFFAWSICQAITYRALAREGKMVWAATFSYQFPFHKPVSYTNFVIDKKIL